jgi:hypothetical protein
LFWKPELPAAVIVISVALFRITSAAQGIGTAMKLIHGAVGVAVRIGFRQAPGVAGSGVLQ